jgi:hypothetical protein
VGSGVRRRGRNENTLGFGRGGGGVARAGWDELTAVDFSSPLAWLLVSPPRTAYPSSLVLLRKWRAWAVDLWLVVIGPITGLSGLNEPNRHMGSLKV